MSGDTPERFRAALVQLRCGRSIPPNLELAERLIRQAADQGALYIQTPENTALMELDRPLALAQASEEDAHEAVSFMRKLAKDLGVWLHVGSIAVKVAADKLANRSFLIAPSGEIAARYDKMHMFDVDLPNGEVYRESEAYRPGSKAVIASLPWGKLGLSICYDLRFPALYRALAQAGASFLAIPSAFTRETGRAHWRTLLRSRAIETGCFVFAATQGGFHEMGRWTYGHSMIVSPWGDVLAEAGEAPQILIADIDTSLVARARAAVPSLSGGRGFEVEIVGETPPVAVS